MKKVIALACAAILAVASLAACGCDSAEETTTEAASEEADLGSEVVEEATEVVTETTTDAE